MQMGFKPFHLLFNLVNVFLSALTLLLGPQEGHPACQARRWFVGGDDLTGTLHIS